MSLQWLWDDLCHDFQPGKFFLKNLFLFTNVYYLSTIGSFTTARHAKMEGIELVITTNWAQTTCASFGLRYVFIIIIYSFYYVTYLSIIGSSTTPQHATTDSEGIGFMTANDDSLAVVWNLRKFFFFFFPSFLVLTNVFIQI
jgi:hypothetical protein